jgi:hypothetical protein
MRERNLAMGERRSRNRSNTPRVIPNRAAATTAHLSTVHVSGGSPRQSLYVL